MNTETEPTTEVRELLDELHPDRVFSVGDDTVWVSGMNANCTSVAETLAQTLVRHDIPCGLVHDDNAEHFGGVQFTYGEAA